LIEQDPFSGHPVEGRGLNHRIAVSTGMGPSPIVSNGKKNIGTLWNFLLAALK
jgi:hypothetical protein